MKKILVVSTLIIFIACCTPKTDYTAKEINWDRDVCALCLMGLAEKEYSAQSINQYGEVVWFDDLGCLINYKEGEDWNRFAGEGTVKSWIGDCESSEWIEVETAYYRFGDRTPMGYGYGALKNNVGDSLFNYNETVKRIKEGFTMREEFLKQKKMLGH